MEAAIDAGFSGVLLRASGINWDLRKNCPYEVYNSLNFRVPVSTFGYSYARYLLRMEEMRQSVGLIFQCLNLMPAGLVGVEDYNISPVSKFHMIDSMELTISRFKHYSENAYFGET